MPRDVFGKGGAGAFTKLLNELEGKGATGAFITVDGGGEKDEVRPDELAYKG